MEKIWSKIINILHVLIVISAFCGLVDQSKGNEKGDSQIVDSRTETSSEYNFRFELSVDQRNQVSGTTRGGNHLIEVNRYPEAGQEVLNQILHLISDSLERVLTDKLRSKTFFIVLNYSNYPGISMYEDTDKGEIYLSFGVEILKAIQTQHELNFVMAYFVAELEECAQLNKSWCGVEFPYSEEKNISAVNLLIQKGLSPHGATEFFNSLSDIRGWEIAGQAFSSIMAEQRDLLGVHITTESRVAGADSPYRLDQESRDPSFARAMDRMLSDKSFNEFIKLEVEAGINELIDSEGIFSSLYPLLEQIRDYDKSQDKDQELSRQMSRNASSYFKNFIKRIMDNFEVSIGRYPDLETQAKWRMRIHQIVYERFIQSIQEYFGETVDFGEDKEERSSKEYFLRVLTEFSFQVPHLNPGYAFQELLKRERWLEEARKEVAKGKNEANVLETREEQVSKARADFEASISYFENSENLEEWFRKKYTQARAGDNGSEPDAYEIERRIQSDWFLNLREGQWGDTRGELFRMIKSRRFLKAGFKLFELDLENLPQLVYTDYRSEKIEEVQKSIIEIAFQDVEVLKEKLKEIQRYSHYSKLTPEEIEEELENDRNEYFEREILPLIENPPSLSETEVTSQFYREVFRVYDEVAAKFDSGDDSEARMAELNSHVVNLVVGNYLSDFKSYSQKYIVEGGEEARKYVQRIIGLHWQSGLAGNGNSRDFGRLTDVLMKYHQIDKSLVTDSMLNSAEERLNSQALSFLTSAESAYGIIEGLRKIQLEKIEDSFSESKKYRGRQIRYDISGFINLASKKLKGLDPELTDEDAKNLVYFIRPDFAPQFSQSPSIKNSLIRLSSRESSPLYSAFLNLHLLVGFYNPKDNAVTDANGNIFGSLFSRGMTIISDMLPSTSGRLAKAMFELRHHLHIRKKGTENSFRFDQYVADSEDKGRPMIIDREDYSVGLSYKGHFGILRKWSNMYPGDWIIPSLFYGRSNFIGVKDEVTHNWLKNQFWFYVQEYNQGESLVDAYSKATFLFWRDFDEAYMTLAKNGFYHFPYSTEDLVYGKEFLSHRVSHIKPNPELLARYIGYHDGILRFIKHVEENGYKAPTRIERGRRSEESSEVTSEDLFDLLLNKVDLLNLIIGQESREDLEKYSPLLLARGLEIYLTHGQARGSARVDGAFEYLFELKNREPEVNEILKNPNLVKGLVITANKWKLVKWQLEQNSIFLSALDAKSSGEKIIWDQDGVRPGLEGLINSLQTYFASGDPAINNILSWIEDSLQTNEEESRLVNSYRVNYDNWLERQRNNRAISPYTLTSHLGSPENNFSILKYLLGIEDEDTQGLRSEIESRDYTKLEFEGIRQSYQKNGDNYRSMVNGLLLDEKDGILSSAEYLDKLFNLILGDKKDDAVLRLILQTYVTVLPTSESKIVLAKILSSLSEGSSGEGTQVSLRLILEAAGPLGAKVAQFLVTSHLVDENTRSDLKNFFSKVERPSRSDAIEQVKRAFGNSASEIVYFGDIKGSGSINYAMEVFIKDPEDSSRLIPLIVRLQKDHIVGQIANENIIWEEIEQRFAGSDDPSVRRFARMIAEVRNYAMATLNENGSEVNHQLERDLYEVARQSYEDLNENPQTGYRVEVARHNDYGQTLIADEYQTRATVYNSLTMIGLDEVEDSELRQNLARQIAWTELRALFVYGIYDPDGHIGNWVVDPEKKRLLRIDYALLTESLPRNHVQTFKDLLVTVIRGDVASIQNFIESHLTEIFDIQDQPIGLKEALDELLGRREFAHFTNPMDRILYIQSELEEKFLERGEVIALPFKESVRIPLASLAKINLYRDYMPTMDFANLISSALDIPRRDLVLSGTRIRLTQMTRFLKRGWKSNSNAVELLSCEAHFTF